MKELNEMGGVYSSKDKHWKFSNPIDKKKISNTYVNKLSQGVMEHVVKSQQLIEKRIRQITHVPMTQETRNEWIAVGKAFILWLFDQIVYRQNTSANISDHFSSTWTKFYSQYCAVPACI